MKQKVNDELKKHFRPEFLNRIDDIIVFHQLTRDEIIRMVDLMIGRVEKQLKSKDMAMELTDKAKSLLAKRGFDPVLGARPLRRTIQREIEDRVVARRSCSRRSAPASWSRSTSTTGTARVQARTQCSPSPGPRSRPSPSRKPTWPMPEPQAPRARQRPPNKLTATTQKPPDQKDSGAFARVRPALWTGCLRCACNRRAKESGENPERSRHCDSQTRRPPASPLGRVIPER